MVLYNIFRIFLLPSVFGMILIVVGLIFTLKLKKQRIGKIMLIFSIIFYYLILITPTADLVIKPLEMRYSPLDKNEMQKSDTVVLLLGGVKKNKFLISSSLGESTLFRASESLRIYFAKNKTPQIIISGTDPSIPEYNEAKVVGYFLEEMGVNHENIIFDDKSVNTFESAKNIKEMLGEKSFFLVTSAYHMPRTMGIFQKMGAKAIPAPADFKTGNNYNLLRIFFPDPENLKKADLAFYEYFGILFYRLKY